MSSDALSTRVNLLVDLLVAASTDTIDNSMLERQEERCKLDFAKEIPLPDTPQPWDVKLERMAGLLRECRQDAPERQELSDPSSYSSHSRRPREPREQKRSAPPQKTPEETEQKELDRRAALEREMSEASYPKIGPGYSDEISVMSDLTMPTVVTALTVPDEEHYGKKMEGPPLQIGINMNSVSAPSNSRSRNHVAPVRAGSGRPNKPNHLAQHASSPRKTVDQQQLWPAPPTPVQQQQQAAVPKALPVRRSGGAAAQRRQSHMAVMSQLESAQPRVPPVLSSGPGSPNAGRGSHATPSVPLRSGNVPTSVNDFPSLNSKASSRSSSDYGRPSGAGGSKNRRRSLLRKSGQYSASVSTTSSRMLLNSSQSKATKNRPYGLIRRSRGADEKKTVREGSTKTGGTSAMVPPETMGYDHLNSSGGGGANIDLDGVLSTMGKDIDFIFRELSALEDDPAGAGKSNKPATAQPPLPPTDFSNGNGGMGESNLGSTAKIKYTLGSVARSIKDLEGGAPSKMKASSSSSSKGGSSKASDPLLIDEDGFILSNGFGEDPFAKSGDGFADFAAASTQDAFDESFSSLRPKKSKAQPSSGRRKTMPTSSQPMFPSSDHRRSSMGAVSPPKNKESRIDAVEHATKNRIEMLRKLVAERSMRLPVEEQASARGGEALNNKLDFVEAETMKQIARLRTRLESQRDLEVEY